MRLWIDDIRNAPDESWTVSRTVSDAIAAIHMFGPTEISLDHDIYHQIAMDGLSRPFPCPDTFRGVAYFIAYKYLYTNDVGDGQGGKGEPVWNPKITIHSANPVGSKDMQCILADCGIPSLLAPMGAANRLENEV